MSRSIWDLTFSESDYRTFCDHGYRHGDCPVCNADEISPVVQSLLTALDVEILDFDYGEHFH